MTPNDQKKLRTILDAIRFDGKSTEHAYGQLLEIFDRSELKEKHYRQSTRLFFATSIVIIIAIIFFVVSCYQSVPCI